jgi:U3 small nucleolar RNA-associated protein 14
LRTTMSLLCVSFFRLLFPSRVLTLLFLSQDFEETKRKEIERDAPKEEDNTLPGWVRLLSPLFCRSSRPLTLPLFSQGAWGGKGAKKLKNPRKFITKVAGIDADKRQDAKLNHVIISEKKDKKAAKYMLKDLPFPYTSAAQHEHKLRTPMGPEWSTSTVRLCLFFVLPLLPFPFDTSHPHLEHH